MSFAVLPLLISLRVPLTVPDEGNARGIWSDSAPSSFEASLADCSRA